MLKKWRYVFKKIGVNQVNNIAFDEPSYALDYLVTLCKGTQNVKRYYMDHAMVSSS